MLFAGFFRFWAGYSVGLLSGSFFEHRWPDQISNISITVTVTIIGGGLPASIAGGYLSDRLEDQIPSIKGIIAGAGALMATPFLLITFVIQPGFWGSMFSYFIAFFVAEMWYGPSHAQINNMFPSEYQGFAMAVFNLFGAVAGAIATLILGKM